MEEADVRRRADEASADFGAILYCEEYGDEDTQVSRDRASNQVPAGCDIASVEVGLQCGSEVMDVLECPLNFVFTSNDSVGSVPVVEPEITASVISLMRGLSTIDRTVTSTHGRCVGFTPCC